jgi:hypothetical protein
MRNNVSGGYIQDTSNHKKNDTTMKKSILTLATSLLLTICVTFGQTPIDVTDQTLRIAANSEEVLYFGFAEGDQIVFSFSEVNGKDLKEVEIIEYPSSSKFSDFKTTKIENKTISVQKKAVYKFRFFNSNLLSGRICKIKIQRIPATEQTKNFITNVRWLTKQDTTWNTFTKDIIVAYDTTYEQKSKKELVKVDTIFTPIFDKTLRVHSETAIGKTQYTYATVELPKNSYSPNQFNPYKSTEVVCWTYWLGVGQKAAEEYEKANSNMSAGLTAIGALTGYGALASLAVTGISMIGSTNVGDNVRFKFYGTQNGQNVIYDYGNVVTASGRNEKVKQGSFSVELFNDNFRDGIDVNLKIVVMQVNKTWEDVQFTEQKITPRYEKKIFTEPIIQTTKYPVTGQ